MEVCDYIKIYIKERIHIYCCFRDIRIEKKAALYFCVLYERIIYLHLRGKLGGSIKI